MRLRSILVVAVLTALAIDSQACAGPTFINVSSQSYGIKGVYLGVPVNYESDTGVYDKGSMQRYIANMNLVHIGFTYHGWPEDQLSGWSTYTFSPTVARLYLAIHTDLYAGPYNRAACQLEDLTTGTVLINRAYQAPPQDDIPGWEFGYGGLYVTDYYQYLNLEPSHEYRITLTAHAGTLGLANSRVQYSDQRFIPAPNAILLTTLGTGLLRWLRRRRTL